LQKQEYARKCAESDRLLEVLNSSCKTVKLDAEKVNAENKRLKIENELTVSKLVTSTSMVASLQAEKTALTVSRITGNSFIFRLDTRKKSAIT
jgi:stress response protein YsnF